MFKVVEIKDVKNELADLIKSLRKKRGLTQIQLARSLGVSRATIQNVELGKNYTIDTILKILKEMDLLNELEKEIVETKNQVIQSKSLY